MQKVARNLLDRILWRRRTIGVRLVRDRDHGRVGEDEGARGHDQALHRVAVDVGILVDRHRWLGRPRLRDQLVGGVRARPDLDGGRGRRGHVIFELAADAQVDHASR